MTLVRNVEHFMGPSLVCVAFNTSSLGESVIGLKWLFQDSRGSAAGGALPLGSFRLPMLAGG